MMILRLTTSSCSSLCMKSGSSRGGAAPPVRGAGAAGWGEAAVAVAVAGDGAAIDRTSLFSTHMVRDPEHAEDQRRGHAYADQPGDERRQEDRPAELQAHGRATVEE